MPKKKKWRCDPNPLKLNHNHTHTTHDMRAAHSTLPNQLPSTPCLLTNPLPSLTAFLPLSTQSHFLPPSHSQAAPTVYTHIPTPTEHSTLEQRPQTLIHHPRRCQRSKGGATTTASHHPKQHTNMRNTLNRTHSRNKST